MPGNVAGVTAKCDDVVDGGAIGCCVRIVVLLVVGVDVVVILTRVVILEVVVRRVVACTGTRTEINHLVVTHPVSTVSHIQSVTYTFSNISHIQSVTVTYIASNIYRQ